jgi:hypothetical protein
MKEEGPGKILAWMAAGAAVLAAGALLGSAAGRRRRSGSEALSGRPVGDLEDLVDRPVLQSAVAESLAAARRLESLAETVAALEARVDNVERTAPAGRVEAIWKRVAELEKVVEQIQAQRSEAPSLDALAAQAVEHIAPRIQALEARVDEHHAAIQSLQAQASQTEANLQRMITAVEKLADQVSRVLPAAAAIRMEPGKEENPAPTSGAALQGEARAERAAPVRWKSLALAAAIALGLSISWTADGKAIPRAAPGLAEPGCGAGGFSWERGPSAESRRRMRKTSWKRPCLVPCGVFRRLGVRGTDLLLDGRDDRWKSL